MKFEWQFTMNIYNWAVPLALGAGPCDFGHAICVHIDILCFQFSAMFIKD